jgi:hypothetical protein
MRALQLFIGWAALCGLTAAGTYYSAIELDQQFGLQAKLGGSSVQAGNNNTPPPIPDPSKQTPVVDPSKQQTPAVTDPSKQQIPVVDPDKQQPGIDHGKPPSRDTQPPHVDPPDNQTNPAYNPNPQNPNPRRDVVEPVRRPDVNPGPGRTANMGALQSRYAALLDRAKELNTFYGQMEANLRGQGMGLRSNVKSALGSMIQSINAANAALRSGDAAGCGHNLDLAEEKINFLEEQKQ